MTQDERWLAKWQGVMTFIEVNKRNPSKHDEEERGKYLNWIKHNRKLANVEAIIEVVEGDYAEHEYVALEYADRALKLAVGFKNEALVRRVVKAYYDVYNRFDKDKWGRHILHAIIRYRNAFEKYEAEIVKENVERLNNIEQKALAEGEKTDKYAHEMVSQVEILCEYYHAIGEDHQVEELLDRLVKVIKLSITARGGMWGQGMLDQMQKRYRQYGMDNKANRLFGDISELGKKTMEMRRYKEHAKEFPLEDMISTVLFDGLGTTTSRLGAGKNPEEQKLHYFMYKNMQIGSLFMHLHMEELKKEQDVTVETLMGMFDGCPLVTDDMKMFLRRGFEAYLADDHMVCCHILIPQIEALVRRLVYLNGGEVIRQGEDPAVGNEYLSLDSLLDTEVAKAVMKEDMINYFRVLLVSPSGWNLRNLFCHGLLTAGSFDYTMSDRVVHVLMILSQFKVTEKEE